MVSQNRATLVGVRRYTLFLRPHSSSLEVTREARHAAESRDGHAAIPDDLSGGMSRSAGMSNRARSLRTIVMLSSRLPVKTSLTRLAVPKRGMRFATRKSVLIHQIGEKVGQRRHASRP